MSLADMLAYAKFHLGDGTGADGKPVLARSSLEQMRTPGSVRSEPMTRWASDGICARWVG